MLKRILFMSVATGMVVLTSCKNDKDPAPKASNGNGPRSKKEIHFCTAEFPHTEAHRNEKSTGVMNKSAKWPNGSTIRVKFLNGDSYVQSKVQEKALQWTQFANIKLQFVQPTENADVKVGFQFNGDVGSWSVYGTQCQDVSQDQPTMNFGWFDANTSDEEFQRVAVHEFGHALGLVHEHLSPAVDIHWNKEAVYDYFAGPPNNWSRDQVDNNLFNKFSATTTNYTQFDPQSIMEYSIDPSWTTDGFSIGNNTSLSSMDKLFIGDMYPFSGGQKNFLFPGQFISAGVSTVKSPSGRYTLKLNTDGVLAIYDGSTAVWSTPTKGKPVTKCRMQSDGNLVLYGSDGTAYWASNTWGKDGAYFVMQDDGNGVIYQNSDAVWDSWGNH